MLRVARLFGMSLIRRGIHPKKSFVFMWLYICLAVVHTYSFIFILDLVSCILAAIVSAICSCMDNY